MIELDLTPPANLDPVEFDFAAAAAAQSALLSCASVVDRSAQHRAGDARNAVLGWTGDQHTAFEATEDTLSWDASTIVTQLRAGAAKLKAAADAARAENNRRARALTAWNRQLAATRAKLTTAGW